MKKVLLIAYYFPPVAASGAMRPLAFCKYLRDHGWQPRVLTTDPASVYPPHPIDEQLSKKLPGDVRVDRVPHGNPLQRVIEWRDRWRRSVGGPPSPAKAAESKTPSSTIDKASGSTEGGMTRGLKHLVLDGLFAYPDPQCAWLKPAVTVARRWPRADVPNVVYATGGPWTSLLVGKSLAEYWDVPLVVDYRDPWTNNPYVSFVSPILNERAKALERAVCHRADGLIANTEELKCQLQLSYPETAQRTIAITNGYDPESFPEVEISGDVEETSSAKSSDGALELCHFGTVYGKRTPAVLLQTVLDLHREGRLTGTQLRLRFVGAWEVDDSRCEESARELEKVGLLKREPPIPYHTCLRQMAAAGALLVIQPDSPLQIPGKIYEYIATRRPLVLIGGEGATANLVTGNRFGVACPNSGARIRGLVLDLLEGRQTLRPPDPSQVSRFSYRNLTAELARVFDAVSAGERPTKFQGN